MAFKIRPFLHETNSSSSHTLIKLGNMVYSEIPKKVELSEFGCSWGLVSSAYDKLSYILTEYVMHTQVNKDRPESESVKRFKEVVKQLLYDEYIEYSVVYNSWGPTCYVDHQSVGLIADSPFAASVETLKEFITNDAYKIIIGNDETNQPYDLLGKNHSTYYYIAHISVGATKFDIYFNNDDNLLDALYDEMYERFSLFGAITIVWNNSTAILEKDGKELRIDLLIEGNPTFEESVEVI